MNKEISFFKKTAVVSFSGGMDSTCLVMHLLAQGHEVYAYSFDYGQNHRVELDRASKNAEYLRSLGLPVYHKIINLQDVFAGDPSTLVQHEKSPEGDYRSETMKATVVNNRNVIFSSVIFAKALSLAKRNLANLTLDAKLAGEERTKEQLRKEATVTISLGVHAGDHAIYPDCTEESVNMARELFRISNWDSDLVKYDAPFVNAPKSGVLAFGIGAMSSLGLTEEERDMVLSNTISCYNATEDGVSCGKCGTCVERLEAFKMVGLKDPVHYAADVQ